MTTKLTTEIPEFVMDWADVAKALFVEKGITEGLWRIGVQLRFAGVTINWMNPDNQEISSPTAMVGVEGIALFKAAELGPMVFDAAKLVGRKQRGGLSEAFGPSAKKVPATLGGLGLEAGAARKQPAGLGLSSIPAKKRSKT